MFFSEIKGGATIKQSPVALRLNPAANNDLKQLYPALPGRSSIRKINTTHHTVTSNVCYTINIF